MTRSAGKIIMTILWDSEGILLVDFLPHDTTINGPYYTSLFHQLHSSIREKRRGKLTHGVLLLHDNTPGHKSNTTQTAIQYRGFIGLNHPAYSPDITTSDCHLFSNVKNFVSWQEF